MFHAESYDDRQMVDVTAVTPTNSPSWLHVGASDVTNVTGRISQLVSATAAKPPPSLELGDGTTVAFPALEFSTGAANDSGTLSFLVTGLAPVDRSLSLDIDLSLMRVTGAAWLE